MGPFLTGLFYLFVMKSIFWDIIPMSYPKMYLLLVHLIALSVTQDYIALNEWTTMNNELQSMWKEAVMGIYLKTNRGSP